MLVCTTPGADGHHSDALLRQLAAQALAEHQAPRTFVVAYADSALDGR